MANIKISELDELQKATDQDLLVIVDVDNNRTKKIQTGNLGILVPKTTNTTSDTDVYSCNYVNNEVDKLLPENSKTTGTTNTYSCDYINNAMDNNRLKSAILVGLSDNANITISTSWGGAEVPFNKVIRQIGNGLTLDTSTGIVTASEEVKAVRISYGILLQEAYTTNIYPRIIAPTGTPYFNGFGNPSNGIPLTGEIIGDCSTSKTMYTEVKASQAGTVKIKGTELYTYMLVEEL